MTPEIQKFLGVQTEREAARVERLIARAWAIAGAGCRSVALQPPNSTIGRGIVTLHEWPRLRLLRRTACYCGAERK